MAERKKPGRSKGRRTKDRVLQARIPEQLDDELRDRAEQLGMSVSTIVRNVLLHTFDLVEGVVTDSAQIGRALQGRAAAPQPEQLPAPAEASAEILGWQELTLNLNGICESCNEILPRGARAAVGVPTQSRPTFLCLDCLGSLSNGASGHQNTAESAADSDQADQ